MTILGEFDREIPDEVVQLILNGTKTPLRFPRDLKHLTVLNPPHDDLTFLGEVPRLKSLNTSAIYVGNLPCSLRCLTLTNFVPPREMLAALRNLRLLEVCPSGGPSGQVLWIPPWVTAVSTGVDIDQESLLATKQLRRLKTLDVAACSASVIHLDCRSASVLPPNLRELRITGRLPDKLPRTIEKMTIRSPVAVDLSKTSCRIHELTLEDADMGNIEIPSVGVLILKNCQFNSDLTKWEFEQRISNMLIYRLEIHGMRNAVFVPPAVMECVITESLVLPNAFVRAERLTELTMERCSIPKPLKLPNQITNLRLLVQEEPRIRFPEFLVTLECHPAFRHWDLFESTWAPKMREESLQNPDQYVPYPRFEAVEHLSHLRTIVRLS